MASTWFALVIDYESSTKSSLNSFRFGNWASNGVFDAIIGHRTLNVTSWKRVLELAIELLRHGLNTQ